jgi:hypothetical protein
MSLHNGTANTSAMFVRRGASARVAGPIGRAAFALLCGSVGLSGRCDEPVTGHLSKLPGFPPATAPLSEKWL